MATDVSEVLQGKRSSNGDGSRKQASGRSMESGTSLEFKTYVHAYIGSLFQSKYVAANIRPLSERLKC